MTRWALVPLRPWIYLTAEAVYTPADIDDITEALVRLRQRCERPDAPFVAGPHCQHCEALGVCSAAEKEVADAMALVPTDARTQTRSLGPHTLSRLLSCMRLLRMLEDEVRRQAHAVWDKGGEIPGWRRVRTRAPRRWRDEGEARAKLEQWLQAAGRQDVQVVREVLISPHEVEQAVGKDISPLIETLTDTIPIWRIIGE